MKSYDKDVRFMATRDLTQAFVATAENLASNRQEEICSALLSHLEDPYIEIQANAVRSLQIVCPVIRHDLVCM